jgi:rfaE bifunctional protein kinase chain/domain
MPELPYAPPPNRKRIEHMLAALGDVHVVVMGDLCLDAYWEVDSRLSEDSVETGLSTIPVTETRYSLGGACNVAANLTALGVGHVEVIGLMGSDPFAGVLAKGLRDAGIRRDRAFTQQAQWHTHTYVKVTEGGREGNRIDFGNANVLTSRAREALLEAAAHSLRHASCLVVNQQVRAGIHDAAMRRDLARLITAEARIPVLVDSRSFPDDYAGSIRKLNTREAGALLPSLGDEGPGDGGDPVTAARLAAQLQDRWNQPVVVTRGERGCVVCSGGEAVAVPAVRRPAPLDPVGAGDSLLAGIAAALAAGHDLVAGAWLGTLAAGVTVTKVGRTGTATPAEMLGLVDELTDEALSFD